VPSGVAVAVVVFGANLCGRVVLRPPRRFRLEVLVVFGVLMRRWLEPILSEGLAGWYYSGEFIRLYSRQTRIFAFAAAVTGIGDRFW